MTPFAFASRARNGIAIAMSIGAVLMIVLYLTAPVSAQEAIVAKFEAASHPTITGVVKGDPRHAHIKLTFRDAHKHLLAVRYPYVAKSGAWRSAIPPHAAKVAVVIHDDGRTVEAVETLMPGHSLHLTAVFSGGGSGLVPVLFNY